MKLDSYQKELDSYLLSRSNHQKQFVSMNGFASSISSITSGVPFLQP